MYTPIRILFLASWFIFNTSTMMVGQAKFQSKNNLHIQVSGTSTMHDWIMKSSSGECSAVFTLDANGDITALTGLEFSVSSKALKSGKNSMDKNAYKALKSDKFPTITAILKKGTVVSKDAKIYIVNATLQLTIAGKTLETDIVATAKKINDGSFNVKGDKKLNMVDFSVEPPSFMLGAVKTGKEVTISFDVVLDQI